MDLVLNVHQLRAADDGREEPLVAALPSSIIDVSDSEMRFETPINVVGRAYAAADDIIVELAIDTEVMQPCRICNAWTAHPVNLDKVLFHVHSNECSNDQLDLVPLIREEVLLAVDGYVECRDTGCPDRDQLSHYLK